MNERIQQSPDWNARWFPDSQGLVTTVNREQYAGKAVFAFETVSKSFVAQNEVKKSKFVTKKLIWNFFLTSKKIEAQ